MDIVLMIDRMMHHQIYTLTKRELYKNFFDVYKPKMTYYQKKKLLENLLISKVLIQTKRDKLLKFNKCFTKNNAVVIFE